MSKEKSTDELDPAAFVDLYFDRWNSGDADAVVSSFADGGIYRDPTVGEITPALLKAYIAELRRSFPDLRWVVRRPPLYVAEPRTIVCEWRMTGTQRGAISGRQLGFPLDLPPTGRSGAAEGVDIIRIDPQHRILSHDTYFDRHELYASLDLKVIVYPRDMLGATVGWAVHLPARTEMADAPTAYSLTWIQPRSEADAKRIIDTTQAIVFESAAQPGFGGFVAAIFEDRMYTVSAWSKAEDVRAAGSGVAHRAATQQFFQGQLGQAQHAVITQVVDRGPLWIADKGEPPRDAATAPPCLPPIWW